MTRVLFFLFFLSTTAFSQVVDSDSLVNYIKIQGDSIIRSSIDLDKVVLLPKKGFKNSNEIKKYLILKRKTLKVYSYAVLASNRLTKLNERLAPVKRRRDRKNYTKKIQKFIVNEFYDELRKFTQTEGQILIKLIHRQTGTTSHKLIKELRNGWIAFWYNNTARLFNMSLKKEFDPYTVEEDYLIEDIIQRALRDKKLEYQELAGFENRSLWFYLKSKINLKSYGEIGCPQWGLFQLAKKDKIKTFFIRRKEKNFWGKKCFLSKKNCILLKKKEIGFYDLIYENLINGKKKIDLIGIFQYLDHIRRPFNFLKNLNKISNHQAYIVDNYESFDNTVYIQHFTGWNEKAFKWIAKKFNKKLLNNFKREENDLFLLI